MLRYFHPHPRIFLPLILKENRRRRVGGEGGGGEKHLYETHINWLPPAYADQSGIKPAT